MSTAIIILNYNNYQDTINCIKSIELYNSASIKYIIVDNGSKSIDNIVHITNFLKKEFPKKYKLFNENDSLNATNNLPYISFVISKTNNGYAGGNNKGLNLAYTDPDITKVMILNNDVLFVEDIIEKLVLISNKLPQCAIVSPLLYKKGMQVIDYNCARLNHTNKEIIFTYLLCYRDLFGYISKNINKRRILIQHPECLEQNYVKIELPSGSCMLANKSLFQSIGSFDPNTFLYFEENILYKKIKKENLVNYLVPNVKCIHLGASSTEKVPSAFILKASLNSARYYLQNYGNMTSFQKIIFKIAYLLFSIKIFLVKYIKNK